MLLLKGQGCIMDHSAKSQTLAIGHLMPPVCRISKGKAGLNVDCLYDETFDL